MANHFKVRPNVRILVAGVFAFFGAGQVAQADSTIQKCIRPDGSVLYQQDVCPPGTDSKTVGSNGLNAHNLTLIANSNHQYSTTLTINGITVPGHIDTGATFVTVSLGTASQLHISSDGTQFNQLQTANGVISAANKKIAVLKVGNFELYNIEICIVADSPTLIGMSALSQLKFSNENGNLVLSKR